MDKMSILSRVIAEHNVLAKVLVSGDSAILVGQVLSDMRDLAESIKSDIEKESNESTLK